MSGSEIAVIIGKKLTEELRNYDDFSAAIGYDNPRFTITVVMEAQEIEPKRVEVVVHVPTAALPEGVKTKAKSTRITAEVGPLAQPDKERAEAGLPVPSPERNDLTGEVADYKANEGPF